MLHVLLMAGGGGTRFWPRSRQRRPKQFLPLSGDRSLLQQAYDRIESLVPPERTWVITAEDQRRLIAEQLPQLLPDRVICEPCRRDTAACIGVGAALIAADDPNAVMVATPADHVIEPAQVFRSAIQAGARLAEEHPSASIIFGIAPTYPATGYGYIHRGEPQPACGGIPVFAVREFREKPDEATAQEYVRSGDYFWNSGIFVWRAATLLGELKRQQPEIEQAAQAIARAWNTPQREAVFRQAYAPLKRISIDYAVMEHCQQAIVLQAPFTWDDLGSWRAVERMNPQDADGNTVLASHCGLDTRNCIIVGDADRLIATVGVDNLLIVQDGDAILVADKRDESATKRLVEHLRQRGWDRYL